MKKPSRFFRIQQVSCFFDAFACAFIDFFSFGGALIMRGLFHAIDIIATDTVILLVLCPILPAHEVFPGALVHSTRPVHAPISLGCHLTALQDHFGGFVEVRLLVKFRDLALDGTEREQSLGILHFLLLVQGLVTRGLCADVVVEALEQVALKWFLIGTYSRVSSM